MYVSQGLPGTPNVAYAELTQATIEPNWPSQAPEVVRTLNAEMQAQLDSYEIEFYELVTPEKLAERGSHKRPTIEDPCKPRRGLL